MEAKNPELFSNELRQALREARVLIVGVGGLGSFVATEMAYLGFGHLILVDKDTVSPSNLNRQILYTPADIGKSKVLVAAKRLREINPEIKVEAIDSRLTHTNGTYIVRRADIIVDCSDNFATKKLLNRLAIYHGKPLITAGVGTWEGWVATFPFYLEELSQIPCLECLFPLDDKSSHLDLEKISGTALVSTVATVASVQVNETIKLLTEDPDNLEGKTLLIDMKTYQCTPIKIKKNPQCKVCNISTNQGKTQK
ncbi:MAG: HesA/MoeB/ThiF family protein [Aquificae bacterium]|jgi:adenylyltransferase/sulfurtransferase|nr:HesA/MoeB/ThiF family protein [Aquificota bacterium]